MKYGDLTLGQVEALVNKLGGLRNVRDVLTGKKHVTLMPIKDLRIWNTVQLGDGTERDLVLVSAHELGFGPGASRQDIYERALAYGLAPCPRSIVNSLHTTHTQRFFVGGAPPMQGEGNPGAFQCTMSSHVHSSEYILDAWLQEGWNQDSLWLFVLPRP